MLTLKYPILQSGFLALSETGLVKQIPGQPSFSDTILFIRSNTEFDNHFYSETISKLFEEWQSNFVVMKDPKFQHRILEQAMKAFGTSVLDWIDFQSNKPGFTQTHKQFLTRMSEWMGDGNEPSMVAEEAVRWVGFLGPSQGNNIDMHVGELAHVRGMATLSQAIINWVSKESGYESLLVHLYVIFGKRVGHTFKQMID